MSSMTDMFETKGPIRKREWVISGIAKTCERLRAAELTLALSCFWQDLSQQKQRMLPELTKKGNQASRFICCTVTALSMSQSIPFSCSQPLSIKPIPALTSELVQPSFSAVGHVSAAPCLPVLPPCFSAFRPVDTCSGTSFRFAESPGGIALPLVSPRRPSRAQAI